MNNKYRYEKTHDIDKEKFAKLLLRAKGKRTMKNFAELCEANPSTFTRIIQKANKGASSTELLEAIALNAAPESGVTLDELADANGYTIVKDRGIKAIAMDSQRSNMEMLVRNVFIQELIDRDAEVRMGNIRYNFSKSMALSPDALIMTNAFGRDNEIWFVDTLTVTSDSRTKFRNKSAYKRMVFDKLSRFVFISMNKIELFRPSRFSLAILDREIYELIVEEFAETQVPTYISLILIDTLNSKIIKEHVLPHFTEGEQSSYFMTTPSSTDNEVFYLNDYDDRNYEEEIYDEENTDSE